MILGLKMLSLIEFNQLSDLLNKIAEELDIPDHLYEDAVIRYEDIGDWLSETDSDLKIHSPEIYPQGSFKLGTVVRPISENEDYDIDLVCRLEIKKEQTTQAELKEAIGSRLKQRDDLNKILEVSRRCWILNFPKQFHMDVLPSIPNLEHLPTGILLTDTKLTCWQRSNPKAYAEWFYERMKVAILESRTALAKSIQASIEDVPEWKVKTPLQRAVQLLKRHRDIYFQNEPDNKPVSIILTTLAAKAYNNQLNILNALTNILEKMPEYIERRTGKWLIVNPVDPDENFADKWNEKPELEKHFRTWLDRVRNDFNLLLIKNNAINESIDLLKRYLGQKLVQKAADQIRQNSDKNLPLILENKTQVPAVGDTQHVLRPLWDMGIKYKASIEVTVYRNKQKKLWMMRKNAPVPKSIWLKFKLETNANPPYEVKWQVVNTGQEAYQANQLRGEFYDNSVHNVRWEQTSFRGTHWVEAFVIKNGVCVARSDRKYVKIR